ncbi:Phosphoenolpyruvate-protein phosphotransferase, partial [Haemophilus influenzae]
FVGKFIKLNKSI